MAAASIWRTPKWATGRRHTPSWKKDGNKTQCDSSSTSILSTPHGCSTRRVLKDTPYGTLEQSPNAMYKNTLNYLLWDLMDNKRMVRMFENEFQNGTDAFTAVEMMDMLHKAIFAPTISGKKTDVMTRNLQKAFVDALITAAAESEGVKINKSLYAGQPWMAASQLPCTTANADAANGEDNRHARLIDMYSTQINRLSDAISVKRGELMRILTLLKGKRNAADLATRYHYEDIILRIQTALGLEK